MQGHHESDEDLSVWLGRRWVLGAATLAALFATVFAVWFVLYERDEQRAQAVNRAALYARVLTDQVDRSFDTVQVSLRTLADSLGPEDWGHSASQRLSQALLGVSYLRSLHLLDAEGRVVASTHPDWSGWQVPTQLLGEAPEAGRWRAPGLLAGRDLKDARAIGSADPRRMVLPVVLALADGDGSKSAARLVAMVNPDHFATSFDLLLSDTGLRAGLLQLDMRLIAASEALPVAMGSLPPAPQALTTALRAKPFDQSVGLGLTGEPAVIAHRNARLAPWVVTVEQPLERADAPVRALALEALVAWVVALALIAGVAALALKTAAEQQRQRQARATARRDLARQNVLTANLIDASATALYAKDAQGHLLMANQAWGRWVGMDPQYLMGAPLPESVRWADPRSPDGSEPELPPLGEVLTFEVQMSTAAGLRDVLVSKVAVQDEVGDMVAVVGSLTDVSAYREAERRSREAAEAARQANDAKSEFVANISHELRTPLQSILGFSEIGQVRCADSPAAVGYFKRVHDAGKHMLSLVEDLLDLAKPELTDGQMCLEPLPLGSLTGEVLEELTALAHKRSVRIVQQGMALGLLSKVERRGFQQVVRNLVANALRFAPEGSQVEVALSRTHGERVRLTVSDRGPGVPAAELESIFAPFVQSSVTKTNAGGTGLGLAICRRLVHAFAGRVWAEERPGGGAVFVVELPGA